MKCDLCGKATDEPSGCPRCGKMVCAECLSGVNEHLEEVTEGEPPLCLECAG